MLELPKPVVELTSMEVTDMESHAAANIQPLATLESAAEANTSQQMVL